MNLTNELNARQIPENLAFLERLSWNFWWSWSANATAVFRDLDAPLWDAVEQNPRRMLGEISELRLWQRACDTNFVARVERLEAEFNDYQNQKSQSFGGKREITPESPVAYFCAEYGVHNSLPLYSGGLGILAGDHLKSASDLRAPLVAVGLFYHYGYFRQRITSEGFQHEIYLESLPENLAIKPVLNDDGTRLKISLKMRGRTVYAQSWLAQIGRVSLYLLDTGVAENTEIDRLITGHLYGGDRETRIVQEMLLGIGGIRLIRALGIEPAVFHLNEGHSAFLALELGREMLEDSADKTFFDVLPQVRDKCVFTTHTPVAAGNDEFSPEMLGACFDDDYLASLRISQSEFFGLGRINPTNDKEYFGVTPLALRTARSANGVSEKHGEVSRLLWKEIEDDAKAPIAHVTNGVHAPTWIAPILKDLYEKTLGANWAQMLENQSEWENAVAQIPDAEIWNAHNLLKSQLIAYIRERAAIALKRYDLPTETAKNLFDPRALTIGFARRVAAYKRWNLLLAEPERLLNLIDSAERPVQFVFAGKAHPQDRGAKIILQNLLQSRQNSSFSRRVIFIEDYDQEMARYLVQGVDVWMNVPRRPLEASGTSGEKAAMNGVLNFSILDGWWIEGYDGKNGFAVNEFGDDSDNLTEAEIDRSDAQSMYETLEQKIVPTFYERAENHLPSNWITMMRRSMQTMTPKFSSDRMVLDYINQIYCA